MVATPSRQARAEVDDPTGAHITLSQRKHAARVADVVAPIVPALAAALGPRTEVVLHDLTRMPNTIVAIAGSITGRGVGGPPTDLGLKTFRSEEPEDLINYRTETADGLLLRSSSIFFRSSSGKPVVCLCINVDIRELEQARSVLETLTAFADSQFNRQEQTPAETFPATVDDLADGLVTQAIEECGLPLHQMKKRHKLAVVSELDQRGFFTLRESVDIIADRLGVTRYTIYNYLNELP